MSVNKYENKMSSLCSTKQPRESFGDIKLSSDWQYQSDNASPTMRVHFNKSLMPEGLWLP